MPLFFIVFFQLFITFNFYKNKVLEIKNKHTNSTENVRGNFEKMVVRATKPAASASVEQDYHFCTARPAVKLSQHKPCRNQ